jgi:hypothetical protein
MIFKRRAEGLRSEIEKMIKKNNCIFEFQNTLKTFSNLNFLIK